jgi:hypothetical protein
MKVTDEHTDGFVFMEGEFFRWCFGVLKSGSEKCTDVRSQKGANCWKRFLLEILLSEISFIMMRLDVEFGILIGSHYYLIDFFSL